LALLIVAGAVVIALLRVGIGGSAGADDATNGVLTALFGVAVLLSAGPMARVGRRSGAWWEFWFGIGSPESSARRTFQLYRVLGLALVCYGILRAAGIVAVVGRLLGPS
jgi:branched-subunit amino acid permease